MAVAEQKEEKAFVLPALPWAEDALAKGGISKDTIQYHYGKHHAGYVRKLNAQVDAGNVKKGATLEELIKSSGEGTKIFNLAAQIYNHTFYWNSMCPGGGKDLYKGAIADAINKKFKSYDGFIDTFSTRAASHFGSGWYTIPFLYFTFYFLYPFIVSRIIQYRSR